MAVRKGDQEPGKISAIGASRNLIDYTYDRVHDKTLPKTDRWLMTKTIWDAASKARTYLVTANGIKVENAEEAQERYYDLKKGEHEHDPYHSGADAESSTRRMAGPVQRGEMRGEH